MPEPDLHVRSEEAAVLTRAQLAQSRSEAKRVADRYISRSGKVAAIDPDSARIREEITRAVKNVEAGLASPTPTKAKLAQARSEFELLKAILRQHYASLGT